MVGPEAEHEGIIRAGARFVEAMATARVPKIVLTVNHASGAGYYAMAGQGFDPGFHLQLANRTHGGDGRRVRGAGGARSGDRDAQSEEAAAPRGRRDVGRRDARGLRAPARRALRRRARLHRRDRVSRGHARRARAWRCAPRCRIPVRTSDRSCFPRTSTTHELDPIERAASFASRPDRASGAIGSRRRGGRSKVVRSTT